MLSASGRGGGGFSDEVKEAILKLSHAVLVLLMYYLQTKAIDSICSYV